MTETLRAAKARQWAGLQALARKIERTAAVLENFSARDGVRKVAELLSLRTSCSGRERHCTVGAASPSPGGSSLGSKAMFELGAVR